MSVPQEQTTRAIFSTFLHFLLYFHVSQALWDIRLGGGGAGVGHQQDIGEERRKKDKKEGMEGQNGGRGGGCRREGKEKDEDLRITGATRGQEGHQDGQRTSGLFWGRMGG